MQALVFWPNVDAGSEDVAKGIRHLPRARAGDHGFHFFRNLPPEVFVKLMAHCACMVGNSSAALREGSFLGTPAVTVGTRQQGRERGPNLVEVGHDRDRDRRRDPRPDRPRPVRAEPPLRRRHRRREDRRHPRGRRPTVQKRLLLGLEAAPERPV